MKTFDFFIFTFYQVPHCFSGKSYGLHLLGTLPRPLSSSWGLGSSRPESYVYRTRRVSHESVLGETETRAEKVYCSVDDGHLPLSVDPLSAHEKDQTLRKTPGTCDQGTGLLPRNESQSFTTGSESCHNMFNLVVHRFWVSFQQIFLIKKVSF